MNRQLVKRLAMVATVSVLVMGAGEGCERGELGQGPYSPIRDKPEERKEVGGNKRGGGDAYCRRLKEAADNAPTFDRASEMRKYREECL